MNDAPQLRPTIDSALLRAVEVSGWLPAHHPGEVLAARSNLLAEPLYGICTYHREATLLLIEHDCRSVAFALRRSGLRRSIRRAPGGCVHCHCAVAGAEIGKPSQRRASVTPNRSIERSSTKWARPLADVYVASNGLPDPAAHVRRWASQP